MLQKMQELLHLVVTLKKIIPEGNESKRMDPFTCLRLHVLGYISEHSRIGMNDLARFLSITPPSATTLVNGLVRAKFLARVKDKNDRRKVLLTLTPEGKKMLAKGNQRFQERIASLFSVLEAKELDQFIFLMKKLLATQPTKIKE